MPILCENCFKTIPINSGFFCPVCDRRLPETKNFCHPAAKYVLAAASSYQNQPLRELIHAFKYQNVRSAIEPIELLMKLYLERTIENWKLKIGNSVIIPTPLHRKKERQRGYNQSLLIAQLLQKLIRPISPIGPISPIFTDALARTKNTFSQTELKNYEERQENIAGTFQINRPDKIQNKNIILVDDVTTSGATLNEAAGVLKNAGAKKVIAFVIAKA